jgi:energy-coupling factor transporter transmembrane protein EcfT
MAVGAKRAFYGRSPASQMRGPAASLDPSCRLLCLALLSSASLFASWPFAASLTLCALVLLRLEGLRVAKALRESAFILVFALLTAVLRLFGNGESLARPEALAAGSAAYCLRLLAAFLSGRLFYASTRPSELRDAATRIARRIPFLRRFDLGLGLSLVLGYIPLIFDEWRASSEAAASRGLPRRPGIGGRSRFIAAFLRRLMLHAVALPEALVARGWSAERGLAPSTWRRRDSLALLASASAFLGALLRIV